MINFYKLDKFADWFSEFGKLEKINIAKTRNFRFDKISRIAKKINLNKTDKFSDWLKKMIDYLKTKKERKR